MTMKVTYENKVECNGKHMENLILLWGNLSLKNLCHDCKLDAFKVSLY